MKKTFSVVYTVCVVVILLAVIAYFGWDTYQSRAQRISDFETRIVDYTRNMSDSLEEKRDVNAEVAIAEGLIANDPSLIAVQVFSHDDGLRLSVVKPVAGDYSRTLLTESDRFDGFFARMRYSMVSVPMKVSDMQGLEAVYVAATLSGAEIRGNLLIILITVAGLFAITLVLIIIRPRRNTGMEEDESEEPSFGEAASSSRDIGEYSIESDNDNEDGFDLPDFDDTDRLDDSDLLSGSPDFAESLSLDDDFNLPGMDDFSMDIPDEEGITSSELIGRLDLELERAASFNQDLSLIVFAAGGAPEGRIREAYAYEDLVFVLGDAGFAVIDINKDLDTSLGLTEDFVRTCIEEQGNRSNRAGIASRNGRLISAERLFEEAMSALRKTDGEKNIVAFRSDPEKYREFLRSKEL